MCTMDKFSHTYRRCVICGMSCTKRCSRCRSAYYCCQEHQRLDWKKWHKNKCGRMCALVSLDVQKLIYDSGGAWSVELARESPFFDIQHLAYGTDLLNINYLKALVLHGYDLFKVGNVNGGHMGVSYFVRMYRAYGQSLTRYDSVRASQYEQHLSERLRRCIKWILRNKLTTDLRRREYAFRLYHSALDHPYLEYLDLLVEAGIYPSKELTKRFTREMIITKWKPTKCAQLYRIQNIFEAIIIMRTQGEWRPHKARKYPRSTRMALRTLLLLAKT